MVETSARLAAPFVAALLAAQMAVAQVAVPLPSWSWSAPVSGGGDAPPVVWEPIEGVGASFTADAAWFEGTGWQVGLEPVAAGWRGDERRLRGARPAQRGSAVRYDHGDVEAWYAAAPRGVEQGFTLERPPGHGTHVRVVQRVRGDVLAVERAPDRVGFVDLSGREVAAYDGLAVWDAGGRSLAASMAVDADGLSITVEASRARFPVTIDPTITGPEQKLTPPAEGNLHDYLGYSIALDGDTALVGAPTSLTINPDAAAYVFVRDGDVWTQQARLPGPFEDDDNQSFGVGVALDGDTAVVGAPGEAIVYFGDDDAGAAYVYERTGTSWAQSAVLVPPAGDAADEGQGEGFGHAVAVAGDVVMVGEYKDHEMGDNAGAVHVFRRDGDGWTARQRLTPPEVDTSTPDRSGLNSWFGLSIAMDGDVALIGAPFEHPPDGSPFPTGVGYLFADVGGTWTPTSTLWSGEGYDSVGWSVALDGDTAVLGAPTDSESGDAAGAAYVFARDGSTWSEQAKLLPPGDGHDGDEFGGSVAIEGGIALVGAPKDDELGTDFGAVYAFSRQADGWVLDDKLLPEDDDLDEDWFGFSVALDGPTAMVGSPQDDDVSAFSGAVYVYRAEQPPAPPPSPPPSAERVEGADGDVISTAVAVSHRRFEDAGGGRTATHAVLSRDDVFADSLGGSVLTGDGPLLFTPTDALDPRTLEELRRALPPGTTVYLLGGTAALSSGVEAALADAGFEPDRLSGPSRVETALAVAATARERSAGEEVLLARAFGPAGDANGSAAWADSVSGGGYAAATATPVLLTATEAVHPAVAAFLQADGPGTTTLLGGDAALSDAVEAAVPNPRRVAGANRAATAAAVASELLGVAPQGVRAYHLTDGTHPLGWAYGLAAAGLVADRDAPLLLTNGSSAPPETLATVTSCRDLPVALTVVGGPDVVPASVLSELDDADTATC